VSARRDFRLAAALCVPLAVGGLGFAIGRMPGRGVDPAAAPAASASAPAPADRFEALFHAGAELLRGGRLEPALEALEEARRRRPEIAEVHVNLGYALLGLGRLEEAKASFEKALDLRAGQANAYYGLAETLDRKGDVEGALGAMRTYVHLVPESDRFRRPAMSAVWELEEKLEAQRHPDPSAAMPP